MIGFALVLLAGCGVHDRELLGDPAPTPARPAEAQVFDSYEEGVVAPQDSLEMFSDLRFYGSWYELYPYGWVWRPIVVATWAPMTAGHWAWTTYGWMWVPYDPFGWMTYNYGFWVNDFALGWVWIPDTRWAPVRCEWIIYDDYICWSPLPPPGVRYKDPWVHGGGDPWVAVPIAKFKDTDVARNRVTPKFKSGTSDRTLRRSAPEPGMIERGMGREMRITEVQVERVAVGKGSVTRVILPADEQAIVEERRTGGAARIKQPPPGDSRSGRAENPKTDDSRAKDKTSRPPAKKEEPKKFKEKSKDSSSDKSKDSGKANGDSKGKGKGKG